MTDNTHVSEIANNLIRPFVSGVQEIHATGNATEHSYRSTFEGLFSRLGVRALNEPKRVKCGAPDFLISRGDIVIGYVEVKDLHIDIRHMNNNNKSQQERYRNALPNLIYTNACDWDFYQSGKLIASVTIANVLEDVTAIPDQYETLGNLLRDFIAQKPQTITSPHDMAERMAGKAKLIKDVLYKTLADNEALETELTNQYQAFKENLIHDITHEDFADIYAETIAYGMFAARLHDTSLDSFSRQEALDLLPKSNPFLRSLFGYVAGPNLDDRISWIIDDLADIFQACDVAKLMEGFGELTGRRDPFLHFYETFLAAYNPKKRKARGVWYTPEPVVNFIVRAVDKVLRHEFGLEDGLADTSRVAVDWDTGQTDDKGKAIMTKKDVHRVQILDPATGTGTFLAETVKQIAARILGIAPGIWSSYIERDLIPRLHGLELLMASYAMCHMKLDMILTELGYRPADNPPRLSVYLSNSLEEGEPINQALPFAQWISREAKGANEIKRDMPIMCVIGNPPYSKSSANNGDWIMREMSEYKKGLRERKVNLNDDYMKFIRLAEFLIEKNAGGIVAMITNNSFLDGVTQRGMRRHLRETFDKISIVNLHGDARSGDPTAGQDENIFDIKQGVSIVIMRTSQTMDRRQLASVSYHEVRGKRSDKYQLLRQLDYDDDSFVELNCIPPDHRFLASHNLAESHKPQLSRRIPMYQDHRKKRYMSGFQVSDFFGSFSSGIQTKQDALCIAHHRSDLARRLDDFRNLDEQTLRKKYKINRDSRDWKIHLAVADVRSDTGQIVPFLYKPFDVRNIYYSGRTKGFVAYPRRDIMRHVVGKDNLCLIVNRQNVHDHFTHVGITNVACCHGTLYLGNRGQDYCCPLYLYADEQDLDQSRRVNFDHKLYRHLRDLSAEQDSMQTDEVAMFDYVYGVLHCPGYRQVYSDFLKVDFPRIPWPSTPSEFRDVSAKGTLLRKLHLMEPQAIGSTPFSFKGEGDNTVDKPSFKENKVWINKTQYFDAAPKVSWDLYIGGYQPAQKWLKDRRGRTLSFDDVKHYQCILKILSETDRIMGTIRMELT